MIRTLFLLAALGCVPLAQAQDLVITGVVDGPLAESTPKAIELYVVNDIADLSAYGLGIADDGEGSDGEELILSGFAAQGEYLYIASETEQFTAFFGFVPTFISEAVTLDGDDAVELFENGAVIDVFGTADAASGFAYADGWAYRNDGTGPDGSTFALANWTLSGVGALDGALSNATATTPFPLGSYQAVLPVTVSITSSANEGWRMLSVPGTGLTPDSLAEINLVRGVAFGDADSPNLYTSYAGTQSAGGNGGYGFPTPTEDLVPGQGFFWYFFDAENPPMLSGNGLGAIQPLPVALSATVTPLVADHAVTFAARTTADDPFYLAGNPFASDFSLEGVATATGQTVQDIVQVWDPAGAADPEVEGDVGPGGYTALSLSGTGSPQVVTPWQGFWLEVTREDGATSTSEVTVTYAIANANQTGGLFVGRHAAHTGLKLDLFGTTPAGHRIRNTASLLFHDAAADGWDRFDASSPGSFGTPFVLAGVLGERAGEEVWKYQDSRPLAEGVSTFRLAYTGVGVGSAYEFAWPSLAAIPAGWTLTLRDLMTSTEVDMRTQASYAFEAMESEPAARFEVVVTANAVANTDEALPSGFAVGEAYPNPTATAATLAVRVAKAQEVEVTVYDVLGRVVVADVVALRAGAEERIDVGVASLPAGTYVVRLAGEAFAATRRLTVVR